MLLIQSWTFSFRLNRSKISIQFAEKEYNDYNFYMGLTCHTTVSVVIVLWPHFTALSYHKWEGKKSNCFPHAT